MQRIGRVNRIGCFGSPHIYINFIPLPVLRMILNAQKGDHEAAGVSYGTGEDSQIYSETEEVDTFGLFDRSPEETNATSAWPLLMELRQFRQQHPEQFRRIKGLPLRARVGGLTPTRREHVTFIRSQRRDAFYRLTSSAGVPPPAWSRRPRLPVSTSRNRHS